MSFWVAQQAMEAEQDLIEQRRLHMVEAGIPLREIATGIYSPGSQVALDQIVLREKQEAKEARKEAKRKAKEARSQQSAPSAKPKQPAASAATTAPRPNQSTEPPAKRRKLDERTANPWRFDEDIVKRFPAFRSRNHYSIQWHHARAIHHDLRLLCTNAHPVNKKCDVCGTTHHADADGNVYGTLSFAIPKGFSGMMPGEKRLAVETPLHPLNYSYHEGAGIGSTQLVDVGTYEIVSSQSGKRDTAADTESEHEEDQPERFGGYTGAKQEEALAKAYRGRRESNTLSFNIRLTGKRFQMQLAFVHDKKDMHWSVDTLRNVKTLRRRWFFQLSSNGGQAVLNKEEDLGDSSILTGRTMAQIKMEGDLLTGSGPAEDKEGGFVDADFDDSLQ